VEISLKDKLPPQRNENKLKQTGIMGAYCKGLNNKRSLDLFGKNRKSLDFLFTFRVFVCLFGL
jgi:hypothetical protein